MDGRTYARTYVCKDGRTFETGFIRSTLSKSRPKNGSRNPDYIHFRDGMSFVGEDCYDQPTCPSVTKIMTDYSKYGKCSIWDNYGHSRSLEMGPFDSIERI